MMRTSLAAATVTLLAGCALAPQHHAYLERAEDAYREARADPIIQRNAPGELDAAGEVLDRAVQARATLQDAAEVDHLAYLARQRTEIARELARIRERSR